MGEMEGKRKGRGSQGRRGEGKEKERGNFDRGKHYGVE